MEKRKVKEALGKLIYGVYVLTTLRDSEINGMPVSWVSQVSHLPPMILIAVSKERYTHAMLEDSDVFAINIMARGQKGVVDGFMAPGLPKSSKFKGVAYNEGVTGSPILENSLAWLECSITSTFVAGDHTLFMGEVIAAGSSKKEGPSLSELDYGHSYGG